MQAGKSLQRPTSWQEFESLCKRLWGEIWNDQEIKKNGRIGQQQHGVDIYGTPDGKTGIYGIQCKAKDENLSKKLAEAEILVEIENAKFFKPALKKLYIASTASKDVGIEEFIRVKNQEHISQHLFEVHLFSWEDISDLIQENPQTHDYYLNCQSYKKKHSADVTFLDGSKEIILRPIFQNNVVLYNSSKGGPPADALYSLTRSAEIVGRFSAPSYLKINSTKKNHSCVGFVLRLTNIGSYAIEDCKVLFTLVGDIKGLKYSNLTGPMAGIRSVFQKSELILDETNLCGHFDPGRETLVSEDYQDSEEIYIIPGMKQSVVLVKWRLISKEYKTEGILKIIIQPEFKSITKTKFTEEKAMLGKREEILGEYITDE